MKNVPDTISPTGQSATTTYAYDPFGTRISQSTASTTTLYPSKYFSEIITTGTGTSTTATTTDYIYTPGSNPMLLATIDQPMKNGVATGTPITRYSHADNLGSTNVTSDKNGALAQWFDYSPYGSVFTSSNTGSTTIARQYIGQYSDTSGLDYLNARYYNATQGQFTSEDPKFLSDPLKQTLQNPQDLNSYSYADDNPITKSDPSGKDLLQGTGSFGWWLGGGTASIDIDLSASRAQFEYGPSVGPSLGARLSGSYDPNGSIDPSGLYFQVQAGGAVGVGANYTSEAPLTWQDGKFKLTKPLPPGSISGSVGAYVGLTDSVVYKTSSFSYYVPGVLGNPPQTQQQTWGGAYISGYHSINQLSNSVASYANSSGTSINNNSGFASAISSINAYNNSLTMPGLFGPIGGVSTPSRK